MGSLVGLVVHAIKRAFLLHEGPIRSCGDPKLLLEVCDFVIPRADQTVDFVADLVAVPF